MGVHPLWQFSRTFYQVFRRPLLVGGLLMLAGFVWAAIRRADRPVSDEFVAFRRREQMTRLGAFFKSLGRTRQPEGEAAEARA